jgi:thiamine pyrophosphate-dependent acetolactate synthase large subunit-like protein
MMDRQMMDRRPFVAALLADRRDLLVVTGLGSATYDVTACGDDPLNFYLWSAMGSTATVGLGLALARPDRRVAVITGDGDMLMGLGSLATIGVKQPANLSIVVLDNRHYSATGMQPTATAAGIDLAGAAQACRFRQVERVSALDRAPAMRELLHKGQGPIFIHAQVEADDQKRIMPSRDGYAVTQRFIRASMK